MYLDTLKSISIEVKDVSKTACYLKEIKCLKFKELAAEHHRVSKQLLIRTQVNN